MTEPPFGVQLQEGYVAGLYAFLLLITLLQHDLQKQLHVKPWVSKKILSMFTWWYFQINLKYLTIKFTGVPKSYF